MTRRTTLLAGALTLALWAIGGAQAQAHLVRFASSFTATGISFPTGVAVDQETGDVYVAGESSGNVKEFSSSGVPMASFVSPAFSGPFGVAVDNSSGASEGDVYVAEAGAGTVVKLDASGGQVAGFTPITASSIPAGDPGSESFTPYGVAVDSANGDVVVEASGEVDVFSSSGVFVSQFAGGRYGVAVGAGSEIFTSGGEGTQEWSPADGYSTPTAIDPSGQFAVAVDLLSGDVFSDDSGDVAEYEASGAPLLQFGSGLLGTSAGVAVDETANTVYATSLSGSVYVFGPPVLLAGVSTGTPANVTSTTASVSGTVNPEETTNPAEATVTRCTFEYGLSTAYGATAPCSHAPPLTGDTPIPEAASLTGLQPNATYHYRLVAVDGNGPSYGEDETFTTSAAPPTLANQSVSALTQTVATLNATINPNNQATTYHFEYGPTTAYGSVLPAPDAEVGSNYENVVVGQQLTGLTPGTTYHFRVLATNEAGTSTGPDQTFTTPPPQPPMVSTGLASGVTQSTATLSGTVDTQGFETTYEFDLGTDTSYGTQIFGDAGSQPGSQTFTISLQGLASGATYHYRIVATNVFGASYGADETFTTPSVPTSVFSAPQTEPLIATPAVTYPTEAGTSTRSTTAKKRAKKKKKRKRQKAKSDKTAKRKDRGKR